MRRPGGGSRSAFVRAASPILAIAWVLGCASVAMTLGAEAALRGGYAPALLSPQGGPAIEAALGLGWLLALRVGVYLLLLPAAVGALTWATIGLGSRVGGRGAEAG